MADYFATVLPGLEDVLQDELQAKLGDARLYGVERGKVYFQSPLEAGRLKELRTADNLYRVLGRFWVGPHKLHLADLEREVYRCDLSRIVDGESLVRFKVNASRTGKHTYSRFEAAAAAANGIMRQSSRYCNETGGTHETEFRLDIDQENALLSLRLTDATFRFRSKDRAFSPAALRPTVAHALVWLSRPRAHELFLDPCCGSGTIMEERMTYPFLKMEGGDLSQAAVDISRENLGAHKKVRLRRWDARQLPLDSGSVDKIVTNLPFGRQIAANENLLMLYIDMLLEMKRVLKNSGSMLCLTDAENQLMLAARQVHLYCRKERTLSLKGLHPGIFLLEKP